VHSEPCFLVFFSLAALLPVQVMSILERPFYRMRFHMLYLICQVPFSLGCLPSLMKELVLNFQTLSSNPSTLPICRTGIKTLMTFKDVAFCVQPYLYFSKPGLSHRSRPAARFTDLPHAVFQQIPSTPGSAFALQPWLSS
jgi:hypothetical protein